MSFLHTGFLSFLPDYLVPFLLVLTPLVFVHEFGHYIVARFCGVKVETFSIGFGPEIFGFNDSHGTRWKFSILPLGGYVKMYGDADPSSATPKPSAIEGLSDEDRTRSFWHKPVGQRAAVTVAGPLFNYIFAIILLSCLFFIYGQPYSPAKVGEVQPDSAALAAGIKPGDLILAADGAKIDRFEDLQRTVALNRGSAMQMTIDRDNKIIEITATPKLTETTDNFGFKRQMARLGIVRSGIIYRNLSIMQSIPAAFKETADLTTATLRGLGQIIDGTRSTDELGGPIRIAQMSSQMNKDGAAPMILFIALLSVNLGLVNLFPVPMLDGGHLAFYACEAIRGRPLSERAQEIGARIGLTLVLSLMLLATWNDLVQLHIFSFVKKLIS